MGSSRNATKRGSSSLNCSRRDDEFLMLRGVAAGHGAGEWQFAIFGFVKPHRKGAQRARAQLSHKGHDRAGVRSPAQENSQGNVGDQSQSHRLAQELLDNSRRQLALGRLRRFLFRRDIPIGLAAHTRWVSDKEMAGQELFHSPVEGARGGDITKSKKIVNRLRVDFRRAGQ